MWTSVTGPGDTEPVCRLWLARSRQDPATPKSVLALLDDYGSPATVASAGFVTGETMANFSCLAAAREELLKRAGWNVEEQGLFGAPGIRVIVGGEAHASLLKALSLVRFGRNRVTTILADDQGRMRADGLPKLDGRTLFCIRAGNVNTGAFDPAKFVFALGMEARGFMTTAHLAMGGGRATTSSSVGGSK